VRSTDQQYHVSTQWIEKNTTNKLIYRDIMPIGSDMAIAPSWELQGQQQIGVKMSHH